MIEDQPKKSRIALAMLLANKGVLKLIITVVLCLCLGWMAKTGAEMFNPAVEEVDALIESGELPECVKNMVMGLAMILMVGIFGLWALIINKK